jgi:hypothetical protein
MSDAPTTFNNPGRKTLADTDIENFTPDAELQEALNQRGAALAEGVLKQWQAWMDGED